MTSLCSPIKHFFYKLTKIVVLLAIISAAYCQDKVDARVSLAEPFGDDMVLQRGVPITVWGNAAPFEHVSVEFARQRCRTLADATGKWLVRFRSCKAGSGYTLTAKGQNSTKVSRIACGDVWLFSGQSNMVIPISLTDSKFSNFKGLEHLPLTMYYQLPVLLKRKLKYKGTSWRKISKAIAGGQQAIPFLCGVELAESSRVPVGIMSCPCAGAPIESFISSKNPIVFRNSYIPREFSPGSNYEQLIKPLIRLPVKGVVWYQGESNLVNAKDYGALLKLFIRQLRSEWHNCQLPIYLVQLPSYSHAPYLVPACSWATVREAQQSATRLKNVFLVVTTDTAGGAAGLHPPEKKAIAHRLAVLIKAFQRGNTRSATSPRLVKVIRVHQKLICLFDVQLSSFRSRSKFLGFEIAGRSRKFRKATVKIIDGHLVLNNRDVSRPCFVRYNWADNPVGRMYGINNLPLGPFNTDKCIQN